MFIRRSEESKLTNWYFQIDRRLLGYLLVLICVGMVCVVSAGSVQALRKGWDWYYFLVRMLPFYIVGIASLFIASALNKKLVILIAILNLVMCFPLLLLTVIIPQAHHGSARWVTLAGVQLMPADIMKPGFVIMTAWFLTKMKEKFGEDIFTSKQAWRFQALSWWPYLGLFLVTLAVLFSQPDIGTSILYFSVFGIMLFMAGLPRIICVALGGILGLGAVAAFIVKPHVHRRVMDFLFAPLDPQTQVGYSVSAIRQGGLFGMGDEAFAKEHLPDAHTDFIYAAIAEDFGAIVACMLLVLLVLVLKRLTTDALRARDPFVFYATGGAAALFGVQICINLATTLHIMPPKGMTLPFISSGGSSFLGFCLLFGMILAIVREDKWK